MLCLRRCTPFRLTSSEQGLDLDFNYPILSCRSKGMGDFGFHRNSLIVRDIIGFRVKVILAR